MMKIKKNEGLIDRLLRILIAEVLILGGFFWLAGWLQVLIYVLGAIALITGITGFCGIYAIFKLNTNIKPNGKRKVIILIIFFLLLLAIALAGSYYSNFFSKKFFIEDYNHMNNFYKQTLFYTGQEKRVEAIANYDQLVPQYNTFLEKYSTYHPYTIMGDKQFNGDLERIKIIITGLKDKIYTGDLKSSHTDMEQIRPIFQEILKRNNFSMLAINLVDFHDAMEKIIAAADAKDPAGVIAAYPENDEKLKAVEGEANDPEIQAIRNNLEAVLNLAKDGKSNELSAKAAELKSSFVKVYLKRG